MSGGEAFHRVWMQNTAYWNLARKERFSRSQDSRLRTSRHMQKT